MADNTAAMSGALFMMTLAEAFNVYGAMNSSPWTAENFGADEEKARSCRRYVIQADVVNVVLGLGTSLITKSWAPFVGMVLISAYMHYMYERALRKGAVSNSDGWAKG